MKLINTNGSAFVSDFAILGDTLYFKAKDVDKGIELWKTDGTEAGTVLAKDIAQGSQSSGPTNPIALNDKLLFAANGGKNSPDFALRSFDGTDAALVKSFDIGNGSPSHLFREAVVLGQIVLFTAFTEADGIELWKTDGTTAGTSLVSGNIMSGSGDSEPKHLTVFGNEVFFSANDATNGRELWKTDGTTTVLVKNINQDATIEFVGSAKQKNSSPVDQDSNPRSFFELSGKLYFTAFSEGDTELWVTDGTEAGTQLVKDINDMGASVPLSLGLEQYFNQAPLVVPNLGVLLQAASPSKGRELWITDGTAEGTALVKDINPDAGNGF